MWNAEFHCVKKYRCRKKRVCYKIDFKTVVFLPWAPARFLKRVSKKAIGAAAHIFLKLYLPTFEFAHPGFNVLGGQKCNHCPPKSQNVKRDIFPIIFILSYKIRYWERIFKIVGCKNEGNNKNWDLTVGCRAVTISVLYNPLVLERRNWTCEGGDCISKNELMNIDHLLDKCISGGRDCIRITPW